jgi:hypothetical protein
VGSLLGRGPGVSVKVSLLLEDSLAAAAFLIALGLLMCVLHIDDQASSGSTYTSSFRKFPTHKPLKLDYPIRCDQGWIAQWGRGEMAMKRCVDTDLRNRQEHPL